MSIRRSVQAATGNGGRQLQLIRTMDEINRKYGAQTLKPAQSVRKTRRGIRFHYPVITAS